MLQLHEVSKRFDGLTAVDAVTLHIDAGQAVGLIGENGAGKSTLMRMVSGDLRPDRGTIERRSAIGMVHQHLAIVPRLSVAENLALVRERAPRLTTARRREREAERLIASSGIALSGVTRLAADLSIGEKAKLELIKALAVDPGLLILDEPTSVLTPPETAELFIAVRRLVADGRSVVFISHKVPEVLQIASRVVVMREGRVVADASAAGMTGEQIAAAMIGRTPQQRAQRARGKPGRMLLAAHALHGSTLRGLTLEVSAGEIVGIVGVAGNGQSELTSMLRGIVRPSSGAIHFRTAALAFIPEDRTRDALVAEMSIAENLALSERDASLRAAEQRAADLIAEYRIRSSGPRQRAGDLSGGNQQKLVLARELSRAPELVIAAEPTRGLDLESARFVHDQLDAAVARGAGVLLVTSDLDEAFALADRIHVIYRGTLSEPLSSHTSRQRVGELMAGLP